MIEKKNKKLGSDTKKKKKKLSNFKLDSKITKNDFKSVLDAFIKVDSVKVKSNKK